ncbi:hypothetical protein [Algoriphagus mannitolivorans]|uniref:hypothetical protein n=1 Tax=Algoriphagus mannitolivorans TaxID=226504 RepID=UPI00040FBF91|nr:hypothetical protein [Algoriphagus mannitolivorans]
MRKLSLLFSFLLAFVVPAKAHDPDLSSLLIIEQESGQWILQVNAPLTALEFVVNDTYGENSFESVKEFNQLLLSAFREKITLNVNGKELHLGHGLVSLGHATTIAFELPTMPEQIETLIVENNGFENIRHSQAIFGLIREGMEKSQFILNASNDYQLSLKVEGNQVILVEEAENKSFWILSGLMALLLFQVSFILYKKKWRRSISQNESLQRA